MSDSLNRYTVIRRAEEGAKDYADIADTKFTKRTHALGARFKVSEFKVQSFPKNTERTQPAFVSIGVCIRGSSRKTTKRTHAGGVDFYTLPR